MIRLYKIVTNLIFILLIAVLGIYVYFRFTNRVEIYSVQTGSMEDNIHVGDYVLIYKKDNYNIGDVVTYLKNDYFITHRIIRKENNEFITKGDANNTEDEKINSNDIVGKVIISGGILNIIVNYKYALAAVFVALYLVSCYFVDGKEEKSDDSNDKIKEDELSLNNEEIDVNNLDSLNTDKDNNDLEKKEEISIDELQEKNDLTEEVKEEVNNGGNQIEESEELITAELDEKNSDIDGNDLDSKNINEDNKENEQSELQQKTSIKKKTKTQRK